MKKVQTSSPRRTAVLTSPTVVTVLLLLILALLGFYLRIYGICWGLPSETQCLRSYHPDEAPFINAIASVKDPFAFPHINLVLGTWHMYITGAVVKAGSLSGWFPLTADRSYYEQHLTELDRLYLCGRMVAAIQGTLCIFLIYLLGKIYYSRQVGLIAAALLTVTPLYVYNSHFFYVVMPVVFWMLLSWIFIARLQTRDRVTTVDLFCAGLFLALAALVQYIALLLAPMILVAIYLRRRELKEKETIPWKKIIIGASAGFVLGTVIGCPNAWFDPVNFYKHFSWFFFDRLNPAAKAIFNLQDNPWLFYLLKAPYEDLGNFLFILSLFGLALGLVRRRPADIFMLLFIGLNLMLITRLRWYYAHYIILYIPALLLLGAVVITRIRWRIVKILVLGFVFAGSLGHSLAYDRMMAMVDSRTLASDWLEEHLQPGTRIGINSIYFHTVPVLQRVSGSPFDVVQCNYDSEVLETNPPEYFVVSDFELGPSGRVINPNYRPEFGAAAFFDKVFSMYELEEEFYVTAKLWGIDWTPYNPLLAWKYPSLRLRPGYEITVDSPSWHWRYANPRVWVLRLTGNQSIRVVQSP